MGRGIGQEIGRLTDFEAREADAIVFRPSINKKKKTWNVGVFSFCFISLDTGLGPVFEPCGIGTLVRNRNIRGICVKGNQEEEEEERPISKHARWTPAFCAPP